MWIPIGALLFIIALTGSAIVVPQLRVLHFFQALIYIAVIILAWHDSAWGYGAGVSVPAAWNILQLFITHNMEIGAAIFVAVLRTGRVERIDTMLVPLGGIGHFILIAGCLVAFWGLGDARKPWGKFISGGLLALAYFALIVATMLPH